MASKRCAYGPEETGFTLVRYQHGEATAIDEQHLRSVLDGHGIRNAVADVYSGRLTDGTRVSLGVSHRDSAGHLISLGLTCREISEDFAGLLFRLALEAGLTFIHYGQGFTIVSVSDELAGNLPKGMVGPDGPVIGSSAEALRRALKQCISETIAPERVGRADFVRTFADEFPRVSGFAPVDLNTGFFLYPNLVLKLAFEKREMLLNRLVLLLAPASAGEKDSITVHRIAFEGWVGRHFPRPFYRGLDVGLVLLGDEMALGEEWGFLTGRVNRSDSIRWLIRVDDYTNYIYADCYTAKPSLAFRQAVELLQSKRIYGMTVTTADG